MSSNAGMPSAIRSSMDYLLLQTKCGLWFRNGQGLEGCESPLTQVPVNGFVPGRSLNQVIIVNAPEDLSIFHSLRRSKPSEGTVRPPWLVTVPGMNKDKWIV